MMNHTISIGTQNHKFYDQELLYASKVLDNCEKLDPKSIDLTSTNFNTYFYNTDGNKSNFDTLAAEISLFIKGQLAVTGIAESNIDSNQKELYKLDGNSSYYGEKI